MVRGNQKPNLFDRFLNLCLGVVNVLLGLLIVIVIADVIMTYIFRSPLKWALEVSEYALAFIAFLGAGWLMREEGHLRFDMVLTRLPLKLRAALEVFVSVIGFVVSVVVVWAGTEIASSLYQRGALMESVLQWPRWILVSSVPLGFAILALQFIRRTVHHVQEWMALNRRS